MWLYYHIMDVEILRLCAITAYKTNIFRFYFILYKFINDLWIHYANLRLSSRSLTFVGLAVCIIDDSAQVREPQIHRYFQFPQRFQTIKSLKI